MSRWKSRPTKAAGEILPTSRSFPGLGAALGAQSARLGPRLFYSTADRQSNERTSIMTFQSWLRALTPSCSLGWIENPSHKKSHRSAARTRNNNRHWLGVERLEDRLLLAANFDFAVGFGGSAIDAGADVATDAAGNAYVVGFFGGTVDFDPGAGETELTSTGPSDIFIVKFSLAGVLLWAKQINADIGPFLSEVSTAEVGPSITTDTSGFVYLASGFQGVSAASIVNPSTSSTRPEIELDRTLAIGLGVSIASACSGSSGSAKSVDCSARSAIVRTR